MSATDPAPLPTTDPTHWASYTDPEGVRWLFDLNFLTSNWTCVYGSTCQGISDDPTIGKLQGCCSHGVHILDDEDREQVSAAAARLSPEVWENHGFVDNDAALFERNEDDELTTVVHDGACIFLNGPDAPTGPGCALHYGAEAAGEAHHEWKPMACWQLPLRLEELTDSSGAVTWMLRSWSRADWGEGGAAFDWWCTEAADAFVGTGQVWHTLRAEIIALVGEQPYEWLASFLNSHAPDEAEYAEERAVEITSGPKA